MLNYRKSFTLVEILVALAVGAIIVVATYASYELVATQYKKNMDVADMHTSGRAIMRIIERDVRMAGFEYMDKDSIVTYGTISSPLTIKDSGDKCCDEVTVVYDYYDEEAKKVERIRIRYWAEAYTSNKGSRHRLYKQKDILGQSKKILAKPKLGNKEVMADYIEDLQIVNIETSSFLYSASRGNNHINIWDPKKPRNQKRVDYIRNSGYLDALAFGTDGLLYSGSRGTNAINIWDPKKPRNQKRVDYIRNSGYIDALAFGPDGLLYSGSGNTNSLNIWDLKKPRNQRRAGNISTGYVNALAFGSDGLLYSGSRGDNQISFWDPKKLGKQQRVDYIRNSGYTDALAFGPDGLLYSGSRGTNAINIWDPKKPRNQKRVDYIRNSGYIDALAFGPDGLLYSGSSGNNRIYIWDPKKPRNQKRVDYIRNSGYVDSLAFKTKRTGQESLVTIDLTLRTRNQYGKDRQFKKKDYHGGNFKIDKTDKYKRDTFSSTVLVRNLAL